eukprot:10906750-Lingulodinium_polyedra.AAC.1
MHPSPRHQTPCEGPPKQPPGTAQYGPLPLPNTDPSPSAGPNPHMTMSKTRSRLGDGWTEPCSIATASGRPA